MGNNEVALNKGDCENNRKRTFHYKDIIYGTSQAIFYSLLLSNLTLTPYVHASPTGGNIVGGTGSINQAGLTTNINQLKKFVRFDPKNPLTFIPYVHAGSGQ